MRVSVSRMRLSPSWLQACFCLQGGRQDLTNLIMSTTSNRAEGQKNLWALRIRISFFELLSRDSWRTQMHFFIIKNFQTNVRWAWVHPTGSMTSHFVHFLMNYSFLVLKHLTIYYIVCNKASNIFDSTTCRPPVRLRWWLLQLVPSPFSTTNKDYIEIYIF